MSEKTKPEAALEIQALMALRQMRARVEALQRQHSQPLAIVGMDCRIPGGAINPEKYWELLRNGVDGITQVPPDRWIARDYFDLDRTAAGKTYSCQGGFIEGIDQFDAVFFGISSAEAARMSPQQRLFLEVAWHALENAGISPGSLSGTRTGVFAGAAMFDYLQLQAKTQTENDIDAHVITNNTLNAISGRVSYTLGLQGPSMAIDTACSSALVAVDRACRSLREQETDLAIAGGVNVNITPDPFISFSKWGMLASNGRCKTFDNLADGFVRAEGCGIVVLKRLSDALAAGDRILAVIRGTAVNQDGPSSGFSVPNGLAQESVIREALANAGVAPEEVSYVETHGTGTSLGDPIEVEALGRVLAEKERRSMPLAIGSVKTNVGHLEAAAGVAGLIKVVLALQHRQIPAHLHLQQRSEHIAWERYAIEIPTALQAWEGVGGRRIAGVSSFGFSGTNAHVVVEQAPEPEVADNPVERPWHVLTVSAKSEAALEEMAAAYAERLRGADEDRLADLCYTANVGRAHFGQRLSVAGATREEMARKLAGGEGAVRGAVGAQTRPRVAFLFTGQGSQYVGMGRQLYEGSPRFRATLQRCETLLRGKLGRGLLEVMFAGSAEELERTENTQPALFALEYALAELWRSWGVEPAAVLGHSVGEYVAACVAGVFSLEDGLELIAERGRLMREEPGGGEMAAVMAPEERVRGEAAGYAGISIAAVNGPGNVVVSGGAEEVESLCGRLQESGVRSRRLQVSHAFHSQRMDGVIGQLEAAAGRVRMQKPRVRLVSNVSGKVAGEEVREAGYWGRHTRETVQFARGMETLRELGCEVMLEVGPAAVLSGMGQECLGREGLVWAASLRKNGGEDWKQAGAAVQALYAAGVEIDWAGWDGDYRRRKAALPTYRFQRQRYWIREQPGKRKRENYVHPLLGDEQGTPLAARQFEAELGAGKPEWIADHRIGGRVLLPATGYLEMALAAGRELWNGAEGAVEDVALPQAMVLEEETGRRVQTIVEAEGDHEARWRIFSADSTGREWRLHASGRLRRLDAAAEAEPGETLEQIRARCGELVEAASFYELVRGRGLEFGEGFRGIQAIHCGQGEALVEVRLPETLRAQAGRYGMHPALLDACLQPVSLILDTRQLYVPIAVKSLTWSGRADERLTMHIQLQGKHGNDLRGADAVCFSEAGEIVGRVGGLQLKQVDANRTAGGSGDDNFYQIDWRPAAKRRGQEKSRPPGRWLIFADGGGTGDALAKLLEQDGAECLVYHPSADGSSREASRRIVEQALASSRTGWRGIVHLWAADAPQGEQPAADALMEFAQAACGSVLGMVQALAANGPAAMPRLWLVSRRAQGGVADTMPAGIAGAPLWGLGRTIAVEHPETGCTRVDLDSKGDPGEAERLFQELRWPDDEEQVAFRGGTRFVPRLVRRRPQGPPEKSAVEQRRLEIRKPGLLENLEVRRAARRAPGPGEVEIGVCAIGLNFRDVLMALGVFPGEEAALGGECAGVIERTGANVQEWQPGEEVIAFSPGNFGTHAVTRAEFVARKPGRMSWTEAATIPVAFLTAAYGLNRVAQLKPGAKVLIHAAAGGVGLAAVQIAQLAGAEVYATAGSEEKRAYLRSTGVAHVWDSRSLEFAREIRREAGAHAIDAVLNSLAGDFIRESLALVAPGGCFLEIGKRGILTAEAAGAIRPDVRYVPYDLADCALRNPALLPDLFRTLGRDFERGALRALPQTSFPLKRAADAFRYMAMAKHTGKVVVLPEPGAADLRADATYMITGGLGAVGLEVARGLAERGARHLLLTGRSAAAGAGLEAVRELERAGVEVACRACDVSDGGQLAGVLREAARNMPALRGIVHAAGVLDDRMVVNQDWNSLAAAMTPKVMGAWNLHELSRRDRLDFFVLFSSVSTVVGSAGQSNYAAANAFLDSLAHYRRAQGLIGTTINWGRWSGGGMAAQLGQSSAARWDAAGLEAVAAPAALEALDRILQEQPPQAVFMQMDWHKFSKTAPSARLLEEVREQAAMAPAVRKDGIVEQVRGAAAGQRRPMLLEHIGKCTALVLGLPSSYRIDELQPLRELGIDSLTAVELGNRLGLTIGKPLPATLLFDYPTLDALTTYIANVLGFADEPKGSGQKAFAAVAALSEAQAEALLVEELSATGGGRSHE